MQVNATAVAAPVDWETTAKELDLKSPLEIMDHVSKHTTLRAQFLFACWVLLGIGLLPQKAISPCGPHAPFAEASRASRGYCSIHAAAFQHPLFSASPGNAPQPHKQPSNVFYYIHAVITGYSMSAGITPSPLLSFISDPLALFPLLPTQALKTFGSDIAIAFSGAEDVALIEYAHLTGRPYRVFSLDTGRLNPETYQLFDQVEKHYKINIEYTFPEADEVKELVRAKGMFSFYEDGHQECCRVRKVRRSMAYGAHRSEPSRGQT